MQQQQDCSGLICVNVTALASLTAALGKVWAAEPLGFPLSNGSRPRGSFGWVRLFVRLPKQECRANALVILFLLQKPAGMALAASWSL